MGKRIENIKRAIKKDPDMAIFVGLAAVATLAMSVPVTGIVVGGIAEKHNNEKLANGKFKDEAALVVTGISTNDKQVFVSFDANGDKLPDYCGAIKPGCNVSNKELKKPQSGAAWLSVLIAQTVRRM